MTFLNIPDKRISDKSDNEITYDFNLTVITLNDRVKFSIGDVETSFMDVNDRFIDRIQFEKLNSCFLAEHIEKEIEIKNLLDDAKAYTDMRKALQEMAVPDCAERICGIMEDLIKGKNKR
jgi:hypothetical protein